jgi:serine/threonine protein kinase
MCVCAFVILHVPNVCVHISIRTLAPYKVTHSADVHVHVCVVRLISSFEHRNHVCIVFELLSFNLYELIRHTNFKGISLNLTRKFAVQLLHTLKFLSSPNIRCVLCCIVLSCVVFVLHTSCTRSFPQHKQTYTYTNICAYFTNMCVHT